MTREILMRMARENAALSSTPATRDMALVTAGEDAALADYNSKITIIQQGREQNGRETDS